MKNKFLFLLFYLLIPKFFLAQNNQLIGIYTAHNNVNNNYIKIISDSILEFKSFIGSCLLVPIYGYGKYKVLSNKIIVKTVRVDNEMNSCYDIIKNLDDKNKTEILVYDLNDPIPYCHISLKEGNKEKVILETNTDNNGFLTIDNLDKFPIDNSIVEIGLLGYDTYEIPLKEIKGKRIRVEIKPYEILENRTVVFNIDTTENHLKIIGPIFPETKESKKAKRKLRIKIMLTTWPWKWRFRNFSHEPKTFEFIKQ